jgi:hypothetical protein
MDLLPQVLIPLLIIGGFVYLFIRRNRERAGNAPLRGEIEARVCFETTLDRASILGTGGFGGTRGAWIRLQGPKRLIVGTDAFTVSAPQALREFVFRGSESSIAFGQAVNPDDCIMITGQAGGRQVQLAITGSNLPDIWRALAGTGAALVLRVVNSESSSGACQSAYIQCGHSFALYVDNLAESVAYLHQVGRILHDLFHRLVSAGDLVQERTGAAPFDPLHRRVELGAGEGLAGDTAAVVAARAVG